MDLWKIFINKLLKKNKKINFDIYGMNNVQPVWGDNFINAISHSTMGINLSRGEPVKYYSSDRIAQLLGNGLLTFIDKKTSFSDFLTDKEIVFYNVFFLYCFKQSKMFKSKLIYQSINKLCNLSDYDGLKKNWDAVNLSLDLFLIR